MYVPSVIREPFSAVRATLNAVIFNSPSPRSVEPDFSVMPSLVLVEPVIVAPDLSIESVMPCGISIGALSEKLPLMVIFAGFCVAFSRAL